MQETFLHYIWKHELFAKKNYFADTGEEITIINTGTHNQNAGPDFINARIKINNTEWAGNVEIHSKSQDWFAHKHHSDPAYNNTILHVVETTNKPCTTSLGRTIPTISIEFTSILAEEYNQYMKSDQTIRCNSKLNQLNQSILPFWYSALTVERLLEKSEAIYELLKQCNNSWEEAFYIQLARNFGLTANQLPFELLAKSLPLKIISKYSTNQFQLEALFFGQAGLLNPTCIDDYPKKLYTEYLYLQKLHGLKPMDSYLWKFLRLRPANFPTIRIAQFCNLIRNSRNLFSKILESYDIQQLYKLLDCEVSEYWKQHFTFESLTPFQAKKLGTSTKDIFIINTIVPFTFIYGDSKNNEAMKEKALSFLEILVSEKNNIIQQWKKYGIKVNNAVQSQALIQLKLKYCIPARCLDCQIGNLIFKTLA